MKLRFSIRDLLWLAVVVALMAGWTLYYLSAREKLSQFEKLEIQLKKQQAENNVLVQMQQSMETAMDRQKWKIQQLSRQTTFPIDLMPVVPPLDQE